MCANVMKAQTPLGQISGIRFMKNIARSRLRIATVKVCLLLQFIFIISLHSTKIDFTVSWFINFAILIGNQLNFLKTALPFLIIVYIGLEWFFKYFRNIWKILISVQGWFLFREICKADTGNSICARNIALELSKSYDWVVLRLTNSGHADNSIDCKIAFRDIFQ